MAEDDVCKTWLVYFNGARISGVHLEDSKHMHLKGSGKEDRCQANNMHKKAQR